MILTLDEERRFRAALDSLPPGMPVIVVDHRSTDRTAAIARERGAQVIERDWDDFLSARRAGLALVRTPWTLMLDADERLDPTLRDAVVQADGACDGYELLRTTYLGLKPVRMWSNEPVLRLFRTDRAELAAAPAAGGDAALHERWRVAGTVGRLHGTLLHESYPTRAAYLEKYDRYTSIEARSLGVHVDRLALLRSLARFAWYVLRRGAWRDGADGIWIAWHSAWYPVVVRRKALARGRSR